MRKLLLISLVLAGCQKQVVKPALPKITTQSLAQNPIPYINIAMHIEGVKTDETKIVFKPCSQTAYIKNEDAIYFFSYLSKANFTSVSSDGWPLAINTQPYKPNDTIPLRIYAQCGGNYRFKVSSNVPYKMCILDNGWKCNLDSGFKVDLADSSTFYNRFKLIIK